MQQKAPDLIASYVTNAFGLIPPGNSRKGKEGGTLTSVRPLLNPSGELKVVTLDNSIEEECARAMNGQGVVSAALQPSLVRRVLEGLRGLLGEQAVQANPVLLCSSPGRFYLRRLLEPFLPKIVVLAPSEIPATIPVQSVGLVR